MVYFPVEINVSSLALSIFLLFNTIFFDFLPTPQTVTSKLVVCLDCLLAFVHHLAYAPVIRTLFILYLFVIHLRTLYSDTQLCLTIVFLKIMFLGEQRFTFDSPLKML